MPDFGSVIFSVLPTDFKRKKKEKCFTHTLYYVTQRKISRIRLYYIDTRVECTFQSVVFLFPRALSILLRVHKNWTNILTVPETLYFHTAHGAVPLSIIYHAFFGLCPWPSVFSPNDITSISWFGCSFFHMLYNTYLILWFFPFIHIIHACEQGRQKCCSTFSLSTPFIYIKHLLVDIHKGL